METQNQVTCPQCGKTYVNHPLIALAISGEGQASQFIQCECGERITFWDITAQLREQKTFKRRLSNWLKGLFKQQG